MECTAYRSRSLEERAKGTLALSVGGRFGHFFHPVTYGTPHTHFLQKFLGLYWNRSISTKLLIFTGVITSGRVYRTVNGMRIYIIRVQLCWGTGPCVFPHIFSVLFLVGFDSRLFISREPRKRGRTTMELERDTTISYCLFNHLPGPFSGTALSPSVATFFGSLACVD